MSRIVRVKSEYASGNIACARGKCNALLEPLSSIRQHVFIIMSFWAMMQEIPLAKDDEEFKHRIQVALSYLGENAANDPDYKADIQEFTEARTSMIEQAIEDLKANSHKEKFFAHQKGEVDRVQAFRHKSNSKPLKEQAMKRKARTQMSGQLKLDEITKGLSMRVEKEVARQKYRISYLRGLPQRFF